MRIGRPQPPAPREDAAAANSGPAVMPDAVILPAVQPDEERNAFVAALYQDHGAFILRALAGLGIVPESARDLRQQVILIYCARAQERAEAGQPPIENVRRYLAEVARKVAHNHRDRWKPDVTPGAEAAAVPAPDLDPERAAALAEYRAKVRRYLAVLPTAEAKVVDAIDLQGFTIEEAATLLQRAYGTVVTQHVRAHQRMRAMARDSERATREGARAERGERGEGARPAPRGHRGKS